MNNTNIEQVLKNYDYEFKKFYYFVNVKLNMIVLLIVNSKHKLNFISKT